MSGPDPAVSAVPENRAEIVLAVINAKWIHPSLGLRLLKANLGPLEDRARIMEFALRQPLEEKLAPILAAAPRVLGISVSIWNHRATVELLKALGERHGGRRREDEAAENRAEKPVVVLGGPEASYLPAEAEIFCYADWVIRGEGELVFRDLSGLLLGEGAGDYERTARSIAALPSVRAVYGHTIEARPVDLSAIESGYRLYTGEDLRRKLIYVEASRGCPFGCEFCLSSAENRAETAVREFPLDRFLAEMDTLVRRGAGTFKFLDRSFNLNISRARRIMEFFGCQAPLCVHFEMVPSRFPPELREALTRFPPGSLRLELGIQTFNPETAALIGRPGDPEKALEVLAFLRDKTNAIVHADLIAGLPGEGLESFGAGFDRLWPVRPTEIQLGILKCLPGTPIIRHSAAYGMRYAPDPPYEILETTALPAAELDRIKNFARFWELIMNRGAFTDLTPALFPGDKAVFDRFMSLSDWLLGRFGRNWGIDRKELRKALEEWRSIPEGSPNGGADAP